jgi:hypothetical protein
MSLILEALKKVERERTAPEQRGFLVLGPAAWAPARSNAGWIVGIVAAAAITGGIVYALTRPATSAPVVDQAEPRANQVAPPAHAVPSPMPASTMPRAARTRTPAATTTAAAVPGGPVLSLQAISEQDGVAVAVINERMVREGETFDGVRVVRIGAAEVEVEVAGARRVLRF